MLTHETKLGDDAIKLADVKVPGSAVRVVLQMNDPSLSAAASITAIAADARQILQAAAIVPVGRITQLVARTGANAPMWRNV